ncbi:MAG: hypothetical protein COS95_04510 [Ignavibacteriales bacterium CG07_land_8_20_14_0_80_59_12]|nr:MAG: hypothetical protein COS95_04510 [Ignavibacteriales bacterium CG07_land_8_20_14_0_80_59_12]
MSPQIFASDPDRNDTPVISVIIPTYCEEKLLEHVLRQFTPEIRRALRCEVIVSDGGSTDGTLEIARQHADSVVLHNGPHRQTIAEGRNAGAAQARGSVLMFVNADTRLRDPAGFLRGALEALSGPGVVALTCSVYVYPEEETLSDKVFQRFYNLVFWAANVVRVGMGRGECQIIRRDVFERVGGNAASLAAGEDFELYTRLIREGKVKFLWGHTVYESPRRYRKLGYLRVTGMWFRNAVSVKFFGRSAIGHWMPVR